MEIRELKWGNECTEKLLLEFKNRLENSSRTFRYFEKRDFSVIQNHLYTIVMVEDNQVVGYAHLDKENETVWLGIALIEGFTGKGYGNILMTSLMGYAKNHTINEVFLTVDSNNIGGINLYEKYGFKRIEENGEILKYRWSR